MVIKVKQSRYRPGQALRVPGGWASQMSRQSAHGCGKVVSPMHWPPWLTSVTGWVNPSAVESIMSMKSSSDTTENRTRDLPTCSAVPPPIPNNISNTWKCTGWNTSKCRKCRQNITLWCVQTFANICSFITLQASLPQSFVRPKEIGIKCCYCMYPTFILTTPYANRQFFAPHFLRSAFLKLFSSGDHFH